MVTNLPVKYIPQRISRFSDALVVYLADFPIYYVECLSERHFVIAGGGGSSRTGVHNQINILELIPTYDSCAAELVMKFNTPDNIPDAIMSGSLMRDRSVADTRFVAAGSHPTIYGISFDSIRKVFSISSHELLSTGDNESELKCVKCTPNWILGGGIDGHLMVWNIDKNTDKKLLCKLKAHDKEISEIDVNLVAGQVVTLSRDESRCVIWSTTNWKMLKEFKKEFICSPEQGEHKYSYRSCRFAYDLSTPNVKSNKSSDNDSFLIVACNPIPNKTPSKLLKWRTNNYEQHVSINVTPDGVMAMTVSLGGKYVSIGTRSGSVYIYETKNLEQIYRIDGAHHSAVTSLEFLTPKPESLDLTYSKICPLLSVSIDRRIVLHRPRRTSFAYNMLKMFFMVFIIYASFVVIYKNYMS